MPENKILYFAHRQTAILERPPRTAVSAVAPLVDGLDLNKQSLILIVSQAPLTPAPGVVAARSDLQHPAKHTKRMLPSLAMDKWILHRGRGVKYPMAFFKRPKAELHGFTRG